MFAGHHQPVYASDECEIDLARQELRFQGSPVPVGGRAFKVIEILAQSAGQLVTKNELMERVWTGAIVLENTLYVHTAAIRKALGPYRRLLKTESGRGYRLLGSWTVRHRPTATLPTGPRQTQELRKTPATNFPALVTGLVGRSAAMQKLRDLVSAYRVVTVTGPGGIGKSALALEVARALLAEFEDGGWLVELAPLSDPTLVPSAVAGVLGLKLAGGEISAEAVARAIGDKHLLLLLDNCEHLIDAVAGLVETAVRLCPRSTVLVTSREVMCIQGETVYRVPALDVPALGQDAPDSILGRSAVELFITRAKALDTGFSPRPEDLPSIAEICRRLDGMPLAIEFAAARAALLGTQPVAVGLRDRFALLAYGRRSEMRRHRTLRATLDWSYDLLPETEQLLLRHLAVFPAGFTIDAAAAVVRDAALDQSAVTECIANLVAKSLVTLEKSDSATRWSLLETIRTYGLKKLAEHDEFDEAALHHAAYLRDLFAPPESGFSRRVSDEDLGRHVREIDNVRAALDWSFSPVGSADVGVALTAAAIPLWLHLSLLHECCTRVEKALAILRSRGRGNARCEMKMLAALATTSLYIEGPANEVGVTWQKVLEIAQGLGDGDYHLRALWGLWTFHSATGQFRLAVDIAQRFCSLAMTQSDQDAVLIGERMVGVTEHFLGNQASAGQNLEHMLANFAPSTRKLQYAVRFVFDQRVAARTLLARVRWLQGYPDQASRTAEVAIEDAYATNHATSLCYALSESACLIALWSGDLATAARYIEVLVDHSARFALPAWQLVGPLYQAVLLIRRGEVADGLRRLRAGFQLASPAPLSWTTRTMLLGEMAEGLGRVGHADDALAATQLAVDRCERSEERWLLAELLRLNGELVLQQDGPAAAAVADGYFRQALYWARRQGALAWELRASTSLARLLRNLARPAEGLAILKPVYERFTEGFDTADVIAAKQLLNELSRANRQRSTTDP